MIAELLYGERRSMENPNVPLGWDDALYGERSDSGVRVTRESALTYSPWWRGINLVSTDVAKLPLDVYRRQGEGKTRDTAHPSYRLLRRKPNAEMTAFIFRQTLQSHALSCGNGYAYIFRDGAANPKELIPLDPEQTYPVRVNGVLWYITKANNQERRLNPVDVLHIKGMSGDGLVGYSVYRKAATSIGLGKAAQKYGALYFKNNATPALAIEVPGTMKEEAAKTLLARFNQMHQGLDESHRTALLTQGAKINSYSTNAKDAQLIELSKFQIVDIANWIGVPSAKLGDTSSRSYASLEQENQAYLDECLNGWLVAWEEECWDKLLREREKNEDTHVIEFNRNALVRANFAERMAGYNTALLGGWTNKDEIRSRENMNPLPEGMGARFYEPLNMNIAKPDVEDEGEATEDIQAQALNGAQIASLLEIITAVVTGQMPTEAAEAIIAVSFPLMTDAEVQKIIAPLESFKPTPIEQPSPFGGPPAKPDEEPEDDEEEDTELEKEAKRDAAIEAHRRLVADVVGRMAKRLGFHARRAAKQPKEFLTWLDGIEESNGDTVRAALTPVVGACCTIVGGDPVRLTATLTDSLIGDVRSKLGECYDTVSVDEFPTRVDATMSAIETASPAEYSARVFDGVRVEADLLEAAETERQIQELRHKHNLTDAQVEVLRNA